MFIRIFLVSTGSAMIFSSMYIILVSILRLMQHTFDHRTTTVIFSFVFLLSFLCNGLCWMALALNHRLWDNQNVQRNTSTDNL